MLDLGLRELAHAQQARARRDLVAVRLPDLRGRERQLAAVVVQQVPARPAAGRASALGQGQAIPDTASSYTLYGKQVRVSAKPPLPRPHRPRTGHPRQVKQETGGAPPPPKLRQAACTSAAHGSSSRGRGGARGADAGRA